MWKVGKRLAIGAQVASEDNICKTNKNPTQKSTNKTTSQCTSKRRRPSSTGQIKTHAHKQKGGLWYGADCHKANEPEMPSSNQPFDRWVVSPMAKKTDRDLFLRQWVPLFFMPRQFQYIWRLHSVINLPSINLGQRTAELITDHADIFTAHIKSRFKPN